jgi:uncharacterized protein YdeI (YjbR/CyaY-like superfamily)
MVVPEDLQKLFSKNKKALKNFEAFSPSAKKIILSLGLYCKTAGNETHQN